MAMINIFSYHTNENHNKILFSNPSQNVYHQEINNNKCKQGCRKGTERNSVYL